MLTLPILIVRNHDSRISLLVLFKFSSRFYFHLSIHFTPHAILCASAHSLLPPQGYGIDATLDGDPRACAQHVLDLLSDVLSGCFSPQLWGTRDELQITRGLKGITM